MAPAYTPPGSRSTAAILALYVKVGGCLLAIGADVGRIAVAGDVRDARSEPEEVAAVGRLLDADHLVELATVVALVALVVALALFVRWLIVVRANRPALGTTPPRGGLATTWLVALVVAVVAVVLSRTVLGDAADVGDRQRIDALRAAATALSAVAAGLTIAVVSRTTRREDARALDAGVPRGRDRPDDTAEVRSEGGLRVVSEEQARRSELDA